MTQKSLIFTLLAILGSSPMAQADCSTNFFGGDPSGAFTNSSAFATVNGNFPKTTFLLSDLTAKGLAIPTGPGPGYIFGTPFNDYLYAPNASLAAGLNGGYDVFLLVNPEQEKPGEREVDVMQGGIDENGAALGNLFILGDNKNRYYASKSGIFSADTDYAYIDRFIPGKSKIRLHGKASDYRLTWISGITSAAIAGTAIVTKNTCDVVGFVRNFLLTTTSSNDFEYASAPSSTTAVDTASQTVSGVDQIAGAGATAWWGPTIATDNAGNTYMVLSNSSSSLNGAGGTGSYYLVKYDPSGTRLWTKKLGTNPGTTSSTGLQIPLAITTFADRVYVAGLTYGPYGGSKPAKLLGLADGAVAFIARFDSNGNLQVVKQKKPTNHTTSNPSWVLTTDNAGNIFFGGSFIEGINLPMASAYVMKLDGLTLDNISTFGNNGSVIFRNGPITVFNSINLLAAATNNLQITNFTTGLKFVPDNSGLPGSGSIYAAGVSDNGSFFGSQPGWNDVWYTKLSADDGSKQWTGNRVCTLLGGCVDTGGYSLSAPGADSFLFALDSDSDGNLYLGGATGGAFSNIGHVESLLSTKGTKLGDGDGFITKIDTSGAVRWLKHVGGSSSESLRVVRVEGEAIYAMGETRGTLAGSKRGQTDIFVQKLNIHDGSVLKTLQLGSERLDMPSGMALSNSKLFISGMSEGSVAKASSGGVEAFLLSVDKANF